MRTLLCFALLISTRTWALDDWSPVPISGSDGVYSEAQWKRDWPGCDWADGIKDGRVFRTTENGEPALQVRYAAGQIGTDKGGCAWRWPFADKTTLSAELRYTVTFAPGFEFVKGGKLPGLCGGPGNISGGKPVTGRDGWSARLMWRTDGRGQAYVYHVHQPGKYGDEMNFPQDFRFPIGKPIGVRMKVTMNTVGKRDGVLQAWIALPDQAEQLLVDHRNMEWRTVEGIGVDGLMFETFHGGSDNSWAPAHACAASFSKLAVKKGGGP